MVAWNETVPAGFPPEEYHDNRVATIWGVALSCLIVSVLSLVFRFLARYMSGVAIWWDDWFALANLPSAIIQPVVMILMIENGLGRNPAVVVNTDPSLLPQIFPKAMAACTGIILGLTMFKLSVLALYYRIFRTASQIPHMCIMLGSVMGIWFVLGELLNFFRCMPSIGVNHSVAGPCAIDDPQWNFYVAIPTVVFDICVVMLPVRAVWNLKLQRYQRIAVLGMFALGSTVTAVSCYKIYLLAVEVSQNQPWSIFHLAILAAVEIAAGTLGCSITTYAPFISLIRVKLGLSTKGSTSASRNNHSSQGRASRVRSKFGRQQSGRMLSHESSEDLWELASTEERGWGRTGNYKYSEPAFRMQERDDHIESTAGKAKKHDPKASDLGDSHVVSNRGRVTRTTEIVVQIDKMPHNDSKSDVTQTAESNPGKIGGASQSPASSEIEFAVRGA